ncbi:MAG: hypothetical protein M3237_14945 [Actinomycetota bacterium]|nr:hypothetical protein [Actinomycetota bacterium]
MSDHQPYPPPGAPPPPGHEPEPARAPSRWTGPQQPPPGYPPTPQQQQWRPPPGMLGAAHKPGAMPLRPLSLGDIYDAAFRIIRFNPKATVGSAVLVSVVVMAIPVLLTAVLTWTVGAALDSTGNLDSSASEAEQLGAAGSLISLGLGALLLQVGLIFVTGMVAHVTSAAAVGRRLSLAEAWAATRGKRWRLLGLTLIINVMWLAMLAAYVVAWVLVVVVAEDALPVVLFGLISVPLFMVVMVFFWIRIYYLPAPVLMLEPVGVFAAIGRGFRLTRRQFWRTFGIALLTIVIASIAGYMLAMPISIAGQIFTFASPEYATLVLVATQAVSTVISAAFVAPFSAAVASLQYLDQRMRKEAYDVELMTRAGITAQ